MVEYGEQEPYGPQHGVKKVEELRLLKQRFRRLILQNGTFKGYSELLPEADTLATFFEKTESNVRNVEIADEADDLFLRIFDAAERARARENPR